MVVKNILTLSLNFFTLNMYGMKKTIIIFLFLSLNVSAYYAQTKDSINVTDATDKKQGKWIIYGKTYHKINYADDQKVEEGMYTDGKKTGIWKEYYPNNVLKSKITYENGRPNGYAIMYHDNGKIKEEGLWQMARWVGEYKLYYDNGQVQQEFKFTAGGKREGEQKYYYESGQLMIVGNWAGGKEAGVVKEYYENGDIREERNFNDGVLDAAATKTYEPKQPVVVKTPEEKQISPPVIPQKNEKDNMGKQFTGEGVWKLYNANRQLSKDGTFHDYRLVDGKVYNYNGDGLLMRIAIYKGGRYVGDAVIEEDK